MINVKIYFKCDPGFLPYADYNSPKRFVPVKLCREFGPSLKATKLKGSNSLIWPLPEMIEVRMDLEMFIGFFMGAKAHMEFHMHHGHRSRYEIHLTVPGYKEEWLCQN